ncbi:MAG: hypothetical protein M3Y77_08250 [Actinomycetota bacterium]|nr:hypothetical protein [Actinomycetota bacterium]
MTPDDSGARSDTELDPDLRWWDAPGPLEQQPCAVGDLPRVEPADPRHRHGRCVSVSVTGPGHGGPAVRTSRQHQ